VLKFFTIFAGKITAKEAQKAHGDRNGLKQCVGIRRQAVRGTAEERLRVQPKEQRQ